MWHKKPLMLAGSLQPQPLPVGFKIVPSACLSQTNPEKIQEQQQAWVRAGANLLQANTENANSWLLADSDWSERVEGLNKASVALAAQAQQAEQQPCLVAARMVAPPTLAWEKTKIAVQKAWSEQVVYLCEVKPDYFWLGGIQNLAAASWLMEQIDPNMPILLEFKLDQKGMLSQGVSLVEACQTLHRADAFLLNAPLTSDWKNLLKKSQSRPCGVWLDSAEGTFAAVAVQLARLVEDGIIMCGVTRIEGLKFLSQYFDSLTD